MIRQSNPFFHTGEDSEVKRLLESPVSQLVILPTTLGQFPENESRSHLSFIFIVFLFGFDQLQRCLERLPDSDPVLSPASGDQEAWHKGVLFASGQNLARQLMETPANEMTPIRFAEIIEKNLRGASNKTEVHIR